MTVCFKIHENPPFCVGVDFVVKNRVFFSFLAKTLFTGQDRTLRMSPLSFTVDYFLKLTTFGHLQWSKVVKMTENQNSQDIVRYFKE